jgi:hypothetical protein
MVGLVDLRELALSTSSHVAWDLCRLCCTYIYGLADIEKPEREMRRVLGAILDPSLLVLGGTCPIKKSAM